MWEYVLNLIKKYTHINTTTNINITKEQEEIIKSRYAKAVSVIGKSEAYLMLGFNSDVSMYFAGNNDSPLAFVEVKFLGNASSDKLNALTGEICKIISEELNKRGYSLGERAVRYHMHILDEKGFTEKMGYKGRKITDKGIEELKKGLIYIF